jgi:hypothetical protein
VACNRWRSRGGVRRQINRDGGTELVIDVRFCGFGGVNAGSRHMVLPQTCKSMSEHVSFSRFISYR